MSDALPPGWALTDIGSLGRYINGRGFGKAEWKKTGLPIVRIQNLNDETAPFNYSDREHEERYRVQDGDLLVAWAASLGVYLWNGGPAWLNQHIFRVEVEERAVTKPFLYYTLKQALAALYNKAHGSGMVHITKAKFHRHPVKLPPLNEQRRIVSKIDELFSRIGEGERALERVQKLLERFRQSVLNAAVTGELTRDWREKNKDKTGHAIETGEALLARIVDTRREAWERAELTKMHTKGVTPKDDAWNKKYKEPGSPDTSEMPKLPEKWVWASAEQVCGFITKGTTPTTESMTAGQGEVPYIKVYNLTFDGTLDFSKDPTYISSDVHRNVLTRSKVVPGDVVMNIVGPPLGKVSIVPDTAPEWNMNQAVAVFRPFRGCDRHFLAWYLLSRAAQDWYAKKAKATVGQLNLTLEICRATPIPLPPHDEQVEIVQLIRREMSRLSSLATSLTRDRRVATSLRQSVLNAAFTGNLTSQEPEDEPAPALLQRIAAERSASLPSPNRSHKKKSA